MAASYYQTILDRACAIHPTLVADESLFQALLLALVANRTSIIVHTPEKAKVLTQIVNILHLLFGLSVVKLRLKQHDKLSPGEFVRLLLLENLAHGRTTSRTSLRRTPNAGGNHVFTFRRSSSYPIPSGAGDAEFGPNELHSNPDRAGSEHGLWSSERNITLHERLTLSRAYTDPTPLWHDEKGGVGPSLSLFPNVLVIAGLEHTSEEVQGVLWTAMSEERISTSHVHQDQQVGKNNNSWQLPSDFFVVYVCPLGNGFDRPPVHKSLIDRFAMSIEVYPHVETGHDSYTSPITPTEIDGVSIRSILSPLELADLRVLAGPTRTVIGSRADLYLSDLLSAVRNHPHLDGMQITARCRAETVQLLRAWRAVFGPPPENNGPALLTLDVTDEDVRKVFVNAVQHRLRVLEGPKDEILAGLIFPVVGAPAGEDEWETGRRGVKEILREILEMV